MTKQFHVLTTWSRAATSLRDIEVDIGSPLEFVRWWRRNRLDDRCGGGKYLFTWTYVSDRSRVYPGSFRVVRPIVARCVPVFVYVDFCLSIVSNTTYTLSEFESVFFGGVSNPSRPHFGMCVTIVVK